jgi:hypothetical protein
MAKKPSVTTISSGFASNTQLNTNFTAIRDAFDNTLSLDGSTPNAMGADLDLNGNALLNVGTIDADNLTLNGQQIVDITSVPEWRSTWTTGRSYAKNDLVKEAGDVYICLIPHTSGTFATDLTMLRWELFVQRGAAGAGTGDMLRANNLSDLTSASTARANLGLGTVATQNTVPVSMGGTGATDATAARTNLGLGSLATASSVTTSEIAAATLVTASETIASNNNDTTIPTSAAVKAYVDSATASTTPADNAVTQAKMADAAVGRAELKTGTNSGSYSTGSGGGNGTILLDAYSFFPQHSLSTGSSTIGILGGTTADTPTLSWSTSGTASGTVRWRYVLA